LKDEVRPAACCLLPAACCLLPAACCLLEQWKQAIKDLTRVIEANIDLIETCKFRVIAYATLGYYSAAVADLSVAIMKSPLDVEVLAEHARIQMLKKNSSTFGSCSQFSASERVSIKKVDMSS
jgi:hypothetical protein